MLIYKDSYIATITDAQFGISNSSNTLGLQLMFKFYASEGESASYTGTGDKLKCNLNENNAVSLYDAMATVEKLLQVYRVKNISELVGKEAKIYFNNLGQFEKFDYVPEGKVYERKPQTVRIVKFSDELADGFEYYSIQGHFITSKTKEDIVANGEPKATKIPYLIIDGKKVLVEDKNSYIVTTETGNRFPISQTMFEELYEEPTPTPQTADYTRNHVEMGDI